jgi:hypothetical protein
VFKSYQKNMFDGLTPYQMNSYRNSKLSKSCRTHRLWRVWFSLISGVFVILLVYWAFFQTGTSLTITIVVVYRRQRLALGSGSLSREGFFSPTTVVIRGLSFFFVCLFGFFFWFLWSHPKDQPIQSPLATHKDMWRIYSNPDPHRY